MAFLLFEGWQQGFEFFFFSSFLEREPRLLLCARFCGYRSICRAVSLCSRCGEPGFLFFFLMNAVPIGGIVAREITNFSISLEYEDVVDDAVKKESVVANDDYASLKLTR